MPGEPLFQLVAIIGALLFFTGLLLKPFFLKKHRHKADVAGLDLGWRFSLSACVFGLLPIAFYTIGLEVITWRLSSLILAGYLLAEIALIVNQMMTHGARWQWITVLLLVLSGIFLTIEVVNVLFWGTPEEYFFGVAWLLGIAIVQFFSVYYFFYVNPPKPVAEPTTRAQAANQPSRAARQSPVVGDGYEYHGLMGDRLRSERRASYPYDPPNGYTNSHYDGNRYPRPGRIPDSYTHATRSSHRRTLPNTPVRSDKNARAG